MLTVTVYNCIFTTNVDGQEDLWLGFDSEYLLRLTEVNMESWQVLCFIYVGTEHYSIPVPRVLHWFLSTLKWIFLWSGICMKCNNMPTELCPSPITQLLEKINSGLPKSLYTRWPLIVIRVIDFFFSNRTKPLSWKLTNSPLGSSVTPQGLGKNELLLCWFPLPVRPCFINWGWSRFEIQTRFSSLTI